MKQKSQGMTDTDPGQQSLETVHRRALSGALAGFMATIPMSIVMTRLFYQLPPPEQYPLPPNQIVGHVVDKHREPTHQLVTFSGHFAYGAAAGVLYGVLFSQLALHRLLKRLGFGLLVWLVSYQSWLPALRILPPATHQPPRRSLLMIVAHCCLGRGIGLVDSVNWPDFYAVRITSNQFDIPDDKILVR